MTPDVFISYRREDGEEYAKRIKNLLSQVGCRVFLDTNDLKIGTKFSDSLEYNLRNCQDAVLIVSKSYFGEDKMGNSRIFNDTDWVRKELRLTFEEGKKIFPLIIDDDIFPYNLNLPQDISFVTSLQFIDIRERSDNDIIRLLIPELSEVTRNHIHYDKYLDKVREIGSEAKPTFSTDIKTFVTSKELNKDAVEKFMVPILSSSEIIDIKFVCYYAIYTFYRRMEYHRELIQFVEDYGERFNGFNFNNIVFTQYYRTLYEKDLTDFNKLDLAIQYSNEAISKIHDNFGVFLTYSELVMIGLDNKYSRYKKYLKEAITSIKKADKLNEGYPKILYIYAKLLSYDNKLEKAMMLINKAISLEDIEVKDSFLRILSYNAGKMEIKQRQQIKQLKKYLTVAYVMICSFAIIIIILLFR